MAGGTARGTVGVDGRDIAYLKAGDGARTIVLVHGFGADHQTWAFNQPQLARGATTYAIDLPGHGRSGKDVGNGDMAVLAGAVAGFLEAMELTGVHLVGHSLGGAASVLAAARTPERVSALTLIAPAGFGGAVNGAFVQAFLAMTDEASAMHALRYLVARPELVSPAMAAGVLAAVSASRGAMARIAEAVFDGDRQRVEVRDVAAGLAGPVQVVWGEKDAVLAIPEGVHAEIVPGAGHMPQMEAARVVSGMIERV